MHNKRTVFISVTCIYYIFRIYHVNVPVNIIVECLKVGDIKAEVNDYGNA